MRVELTGEDDSGWYTPRQGEFFTWIGGPLHNVRLNTLYLKVESNLAANVQTGELVYVAPVGTEPYYKKVPTRIEVPDGTFV